MEQADDKGQHKDLRHEDKECPDAAEYCVTGEVPGNLVSDQRHDNIRQCAQARLDRVHGGGSPGKKRLEQQEHDAEEGETTQRGVQEKAVQPGLALDQEITARAVFRCQLVRVAA